MSDFVQHVLGEVQARRLTRDQGLALLREFRSGPAPAAKAPSAPTPVPRPEEPSETVIRWIPLWNAVRSVPSRPVPEGRLLAVVSNDTEAATARSWFPAAPQFLIDGAETAEQLAARLQTQPAFSEVVWLALPESAVQAGAEGQCVARATAGLRRCFRWVKALIAAGYDRRRLTWTLLTRGTHSLSAAEITESTYAGLHGFVGSMVREFPEWNCRLLDLPTGGDLAALPGGLPEPDPSASTWIWREDEWHQRTLAPVVEAPDAATTAPTCLREGGVYVIVGGAGGIGAAWTAEAIRRFRARVVWLGRRAEDDAIRARREAAGHQGILPEYLVVDATDRAALQAAGEEIRRRHGAIHGVIHSAIVLSDATVRTMTEAQLLASFTAKAAISARIGEVFAAEPPDFVLFFSSMMSFTRPAGQGNYAAGSVFADAHAAHLRRVLACPVKVMNWAYWGASGVVASAAYRQRMAQAGLGSLDIDDAMPALEALLAGPVDQMALVKLARPAGAAAEPAESAESVMILRGDVGAPFPEPEAPADRTPLVTALRERRRASRIHELDGRLIRLLWAQLISGGAPGSYQGLVSELEPKLGRWMTESRRMLEEHGLPERTTDPVEAARAEWAAWNRDRDFWLGQADTRAHVLFAETALKALPEILRGRRRATEVLFPNSSMELVEGVYRDNPVADFFNGALGDVLCGHLEARLAAGDRTPVRILEIGAGTGGTTAGLLPRLRAFGSSLAEYCYTDLSEAFLSHARRTFGPASPFLTYAVFDVSRPLAGQPVEPGRFDVVIATNVLHATPDIRLALRHAKAALRPGGRLLVNEFVEKTAFTHLTFGLLEGWWLYADPALRIPGCPGLSADRWCAVLRGEGFANPTCPVAGAADLGQQLFWARSDGVVRLAAAKAVPTAKAAPAHTDRGQRPATVPRGTEGASDSGPLRDFLAAALSQSLKMDPADIDDEASFADYGVDSLTGVRFVQSIGESLAIDLTTTDLFDHPTLQRLTRHIATRYPQAFREQPAPLAATAPEPETNGPASAPMVPPGPARNGHAPTEIPARAAMGGTEPSPSREPIAIIGMSGRYAQSATLAEFWQHLAQGRNLIGRATRWDLPQVLAETLGRNSEWCAAGSFLDGIDEFDPTFFNISGTEAVYMDPQQRLFLEESWKALEDAGYAGAGIRGLACGVYVGCNTSDYKEVLADDLPPQAMWGNSSSVIPARISYHLDLRGPALAVDTACSSSLVAIHLACQGLWAGETEMALAGGVFVQSTPVFYVAANRAGMLSATGQCHTFDARADGFVPGEGVGVVVLKRLADAVRDRDGIHGIIEGAGINQDGATNGVTAPSADSQQRLERGVYEAFGIRPDTIGMVEAHGTGTRLGDPIEFEALTRAFRRDTARTGFCALGSVKTNVGHTTAAAGVTGLFKAVLALKHRQIPPSLNFASGNPSIAFEGSPFYVNTRLQEWPAMAGQPRRAALSAFGFSGTNAHLVLREAPPAARGRVALGGYPILLTARSQGQLRTLAQNLAAHLEAHPETEVADVSFTLQVGRRHLEERFGCVVGQTAGLVSVLRAWLRGETVPGIVTATVNRRTVREEKGRKQQAEAALTKCRSLADGAGFAATLREALEIQVQGHDVDFQPLFTGTGCGRISLPAYPFARESYWAPKSAPAASSGTLPGTVVIHPLLHRNVSTLAQHGFESQFSGGEFFLKDHVVGGRRILPAAAYLEMARAAVRQSVAGAGDSQIRLKNVAWYQPLVSEPAPPLVRVTLRRSDDDAIGFEIFSADPATPNARRIHCRGAAELVAVSGPSGVDRVGLQSQCTRAFLSGEECYEAFRSFGLDYGAGHRSLLGLWAGTDVVVAQLELPESVLADAAAYELHPSLLDGALQTIIGFGDLSRLGDPVANGARPSPVVPFALESVELLKPCPPQVWVITRRKADGSGYGIEVCDENGGICVRLNGLVTRTLPASAPVVGDLGETLFFVPEWRPQSIDGRAGVENPIAHRRVIFFRPVEGFRAVLRSRLPEARYVAVEDGARPVGERMLDAASVVLGELQDVGRASRPGLTLVQIVCREAGSFRLLHGLSGMLHTALVENSQLRAQLIQVPEEDSAEATVEKLRDEAQVPEVRQIRYEPGRRTVMEWAEVTPDVPGGPPAFRAGGVYLITGGTGGLGLKLAPEVARKIGTGSLVLVGRKPAGPEMERLIRTGFPDTAVRVVYRQADVGDREEVRRLVAGTVREFGAIHGILHAAGVTRDRLLDAKTVGELEAVFAPKVAGLIHLDEATQDLPLEFLVLFSAVAGVLGNPGQADYAAANSFMDAYAGHREALRAAGKRSGRTVTVNWPLWSGGGMQVSATVEQSLAKRFGMAPLPMTAGWQALDRILVSGSRQVLVLHGQAERLRALMAGRLAGMEAIPPSTPTAVPVPVPMPDAVAMSGESAEPVMLRFLKERVSAVVNFPPERLDAEAPLERYGLDSLMIMGLTGELEKTFGSLSKTLFFEHQSLKELAGYFARHHGAQILALRPVPAGPSASPQREPDGPLDAAAKSAPLSPTSAERPHLPAAGDREGRGMRPGDVAIIGLAGRYPKADTLAEFWANLSAGRDCIEEIPAGRWDHSRYYDPTRNVRGKTYAKWGGFIAGVDQFDPGFFNISPREAAAIDPQERLFLECVYDTLEDAGYTRQSLAGGGGGVGGVGVYVGVMYEEYQLHGAEETAAGRPIALPGNPSSIANRVSYFGNFHGPCLAVDTMCSSSLTAIHLACQALRLGECAVAVAGGVNLSVHPNKYLMLAQGNFASSTGRCESFGQGGDGYVPSEGVGAVLLKPLERAVAEGDHIYGVIRGSAINHGGKTNGYTVPNPKLQAELVGRALQAAGIEPRSVSYLEAHGTGTSLGDPIEIAGLCKAFEGTATDRQFCAIGSVKSNIGHCESAAGIAGLTKVLLQLRHGLIAPSIHSATLNPNIDFAATPFFVPQVLAPWERPAMGSGESGRTMPRRAGVSSFGAGGSYAHVLVEEWESPAGGAGSAGPELVILSARSDSQLVERARRLLRWLETQEHPVPLAGLAHTLQVGREEMSERLALVVSSVEELGNRLAEIVRGDVDLPGVWKGSVQATAELLSARQADPEAQLRLERATVARELAGIAPLWTGGMKVEWSRLRTGNPPCRISLPTYPYQRQRCWFTNLTQMEAARPAMSPPPTDLEIPAPKPPAPVEKMDSKGPRISLRPLGPAVAPAAVPAVENGSHRTSEAPAPAPAQPNGAHSGTMALKSREPQVAPPGRSAAELQRELVASLASALFMKASEIDPDRSFVELGLDSIIGVEWIQGINRKYRTNITATKVYDHPSVRRFAAYLAGELAGPSQPEAGTQPATPGNSAAGERFVGPPSEPLAPVGSRRPEPPPSAALEESDAPVDGENYGLVVSSVGSVDQITLRTWVCPPPAAGEVQIRVRASAINFPDTLCVRGLYPTMPQYPFVPGFEVSGVVIEVGPGTAGFLVGDEVIALTGKQMGGHAARVNVPAAGAVRKPAGISFEDACSLPVVFGTVYHAFQVGRLARGEHLLVQTATGGCGLAALQLAHLAGCVPFGTSSREEKLAILERLGVPYRLNYKTTAFDEEIARLTGGRGVDAVLNMLSGEAIQRGLNCLGASGRYLELAVHGLKTSPKLDLSRLVQNQSVHSIDLRQLSYQGALDGRALLEQMVALLATGALVPIVSRIYPLRQIREGLAYVGEGRHIGKVVISHTRTGMEDCTEACITALVRQREACAAGRFSLRFDGPVATPTPAPAPVTEDAIAIIGMAGQFPNARNTGAFWQNIVGGVNCVGEVPSTRWTLDEYFDPEPKTAGKSYGKWMGALDGAAEFDPLFFNISPAEAKFMDPQQRLFLQGCWSCLEDAGVRPSSLSGSRCGVFVGCGSGDYAQGAGQENWSAHGLMGGAPSILASRISYFLNLKGPSIALDTACSSSLTAIATACESLRARSCDTALAGGVYVMAGPSMHVMTSQAGMLSKDGKCHAFDARANGFVPGEGVGVVLLKRHAEAVRDGDTILGVIRGWGVNQDGKTNGITAPSAAAQTELETGVYRTFGIDPATVSLVEAHGTGTLLGDPIEVEALVASFRQFTPRQAFCALGSVKGNIGHLMPAAGVAGLIKVLLALRQRVLPPTLHFESLNPHIRLENSAFFVNTEARPWDSPEGLPRRAAVSSFGFSGTNAHLVVEEGGAAAKVAAEPPAPVLFVLSAKTEGRLKAYAGEWVEALEPGGHVSTVSLTDLAFTVQVGREAMDCRLAVAVSSHAELRAELQNYLRDDESFAGSVGMCRRGEAGLELGESEEGRRFVLELARNARWKPLAKLWAAGETVDFRAFHPESRRRVAGLPTYAFARDRYWRGSAVPTPSVAKPVMPTATKADVSLFEEAWVEEALSPEPKAEFDAVVCFASTARLQEEIRRVWQRQNPAARVIFVSQDGASAPAPSVVRVNRDHPGDWALAVGRMGIAASSRVAVLYLWPLEDAARVRDHGTLVRLFQALAPAGWRPARWLMAGAFQDGADRCFLESWVGFERSFRHVFPATEMAVILRQGEETGDDAGWLPYLADELGAAHFESACYEAGRRLVLRTQPLPAPAMPLALRQGGTYLITGGAGGLGLVFAAHLAVKYAARLFLVGRSALKPAQAERIRSLGAPGGAVTYLQADVADRGQMEAALKQVRAASGAIHGVIHCAGGADHVPLLQKPVAAFEAVLRPKIEGTLCLEELMSGDALDFVVCFSSTSAVLGDLGSCDYAVANRFLMAFAAQRAKLHAAGRRKGTTTALLWPLWREGGMGFGEQTEAYLKSTGQQFLETTAGLDIFERCGGRDGASPIVLVGEPDRIARTLKATRPRSEAPEPRRNVKAAVPVAASAGELEARLAGDLKAQAGALLKIAPDELDPRANFADFGFDSISLEQWSREMSRRYALSVTPGDLFAHPTLEKLTRHLLREHESGIRAALADAPSDPAGATEDPGPRIAVPLPAVAAVPLPARSHTGPEPIAVIGMSGRFPQADSVREFWKAILDGQSCLTEVPSNRPQWNTPPGASARGGFLTDIDRFDPAFFGILPSDAAAIDPRQRLFLEEAWRTFEDAGYAGARLHGSRCGVFVGVEEGEYGFLAPGAGAINGNQNATLAARIAYTLDLRGPNFALTAACASGLVALHQACLSLRQGDCGMALVGGINLLVSPLPYAGLAAAGMLSPDGRCGVFSETAGGLVPGEAVAAVLLKPLSKAVADGDPIYGCLRASGVNYDGKTNGITAPDPNSQADLLKGIYESHGIRPDDIQLAMGHSVGSRLGDPIEVEGWTKAFRHFTAQEGFCRLTSIKPLFGHTFAASGIVNLIAVLLSLKHGIRPGLPNSGPLNPYLKLDHSPFAIGFDHSPWTRREADRPRMAALTATGISGTNAHVVVEEFIGPGRPVQASGAGDLARGHLVPLSARDPQTLRRYAASVADALAGMPDVPVDDVAFTLQRGREAMRCRVAVIVDSVASLIGRLREIAGGQEGHGIISSAKDRSGVAENVTQPVAEPADWMTVGRAWVEGAEVDWSSVHPRGRQGRVVSLPGYPFDRKPYWLALEIPKGQASAAKPAEIPPARASVPASTPMATSLPIPMPTPAPAPAVSETRPTRLQVEPVKAQLRELMREVFLVEEDIDERRPFFEIGMTSMNAGRFVTALNESYGLRLETADIFDTPTLQILAERIVREGGLAPAPAQAVPPLRPPAVGRSPEAPSHGMAEPADAGLLSILNGVAGGTLEVDQALERLNHVPLDPAYA